MCTGVGLGGDGPDGAEVAPGSVATIDSSDARMRLLAGWREGRLPVESGPGMVLSAVGLSHRIRVVVVPRRLRQQEQVLVGLRGPVGHRFRHRVRLRPDDVAAEVPAVRLEGEGDAPRDADKILGLEVPDHGVAFRGVPGRQSRLVLGRLRSGQTRRLRHTRRVIEIAGRTGRIRVAEVQPHRPVVPQDAPHLAEHRDHVGNVFLRGPFEAELSVRAVVSQPPVRWAGDHAMHRFRLHLGQDRAAVAAVHGEPFVLVVRLHAATGGSPHAGSHLPVCSNHSRRRAYIPSTRRAVILAFSASFSR